MNNLFLLISTIFLVVSVGIKTNAQIIVPLDTFRSDLQSIIDNATKSYGMEGIELSVILDDSSQVETFYSGIRAPATPVDPNLNWHFAGVASTYTSYVILKLINAGALAMDDSIGMHMDAASMGLDGSITVRQLMRHTSILNEMWVTSPASACFNEIWNNNPGSVGCPADILKCKPADKSSPGAYDFNNMNMYVLGYLIDSITGQSYELEFQNQIFNPFGMTRTYMSSCDTVTIDSINGIWTTNSGYANNRSYHNYFSTSGANRGLISKTKHVARFMRALFQDKLLPASMMDSLKERIPGSTTSIPLNHSCAQSISASGGYSIDIIDIVNKSGDTATFYGKGGNGMNSSLSLHWPEKNWTFSFVQNDRSRLLQQQMLAVDLFCYLSGIDSVNTVGIKELRNTNAHLKFYPNPAKNLFNIEVNSGEISGLTLFDLLGRELDNVSIPGREVKEFTYNIPSDIPEGTYMIRIQGKKEPVYFKIQIIR